MTVKQLQRLLDQFPDDLEIILQRDSEGNGYSPAAGAELAYYETETEWSGTCVSPDNPEDVAEYPNAKPCVVLWPTN